MIKNILKIIGVFILGVVGGIFADQILWPYFIERPLFYQYRLEQSPVYVTEKKEITIQENVALKNAVEKVEKVVIGVRTEVKGGKFLEGSGLIVTSDGWVVTLADLVPQGSDFSFFVDGLPVSFQILKRDAVGNLVLVKVEKSSLPTVSFADFEKIKLGQRVFLVGAIFDGRKVNKTVNEGIVKSFNSNLIETNIYESVVLAGSPLFDIDGRCLGLNQITAAGKVTTIPITQIKAFIGL